ncbi:MAG: glycoside hydrolase family 43 protein [Bacteroidota bacterium]
MTKFQWILLLLFGSFTGCNDEVPEPGLTYNNIIGVVRSMADPFILQHEEKYYLYGTDDVSPDVDMGFKVYVSDNMVEWSDPQGVGDGGRALMASDSWGNWGFWGAEVYKKDSMFYMFYTVEEHLAVAISNSPLGPFRQEVQKPFRYIREIDGHMFVDEDGKAYLYYVSFENSSNEIFVEELNDDWLSTKPETKTRCIWWTQTWENSDPNYDQWPVAEGSAVLKHQGVYYLFYTANHFLSPNYAVGYATSDSPLGPWIKYDDNPVLEKTRKLIGTGHCSFVRSPNDELYMVYHAHKSPSIPLPRKMCFDRGEFIPDPDPAKPDRFEIQATDTIREVSWN